jgi:hypothetical protein
MGANISYYANESDIFNGTGSIISTSNHQVSTIESISSWNISFFGKNKFTGTINSGEILYEGDNFYLYPSTDTNTVKIVYFDSELDALQINFDYKIGFSTSYVVETKGDDTSRWRIARNSIGTQRDICVTGDTLTNNGIYYLYPSGTIGDPIEQINVFYFQYEIDILINNYQGLSDYFTSYTVPEILSGFTSWNISTFSTGTSTGTITGNSILNNDGIYYLYPTEIETENITPIKVFYFRDKIAAVNLDYSDVITTTMDYTVISFDYCNIWEIYNSQDGQSTDAVNENDILNNIGIYYLYPANQYGAIIYYNNKADADALNYRYFYIWYNFLEEPTFIVEDKYSITSWSISSSSLGNTPGPQIAESILDDEDGFYALYPTTNAPCFLEGTTILCLVNNIDTYIPIQSLNPNTIIKTYKHGPKQIKILGQTTIFNPPNDTRINERLYKLTPHNYPELKHDLYITGCHSILVDNITDIQRKETIEKLNRIFITDDKYRLIASIDTKSQPWNKSGRFNIYHLAIDDKDEKINFGIYVNGGLLVETCSITTLKNKSNMNLLFTN